MLYRFTVCSIHESREGCEGPTKATLLTDSGGGNWGGRSGGTMMFPRIAEGESREFEVGRCIISAELSVLPRVAREGTGFSEVLLSDGISFSSTRSGAEDDEGESGLLERKIVVLS